MPSFITRIEVKAASQQEYQQLEDEMKKAAFKDISKTKTRRQTVITPVEFNRQGTSLLEVTGAAMKAVRRTGKNYRFTVIRERKLSAH